MSLGRLVESIDAILRADPWGQTLAPIARRLHALDEALTRADFPPTSTWWYETIERFYASPCRQLVLRVGRRGGKSSTLCRVAVCEALWGDHRIPPGDLGVVAIVSVNRDEASQRLRTIKSILDAIGVAHRPIPGGVQVVGRPVAFKVYAASIAGVSGFTCIGIICDEVAKWHDSDTGANPAREVLASIRPTLSTQPNARVFLSSSPLGNLDAHANAYDDGDNAWQLVAYAPTWVANPTITEAATLLLEKDDDRRRREYAAIPMEGDESALLSAALLDAATRATEGDVPRQSGVTYVAAMDPGFVRNAWTFVIGAKRWVNGRVKRSIVAAREWRGTAARPLEPGKVLAEIAGICRAYGIDMVYSDQYERFSLQEIAQRPDIRLVVYVPKEGGGGRLGRYESLVTQLSDGEVEIPGDKQLRADLLAVKQRITPNGFTIVLPQTPDGRHADFAPSVSLCLAHCLVDPAVEESKPLPGTPAWEQAWLDKEFAAAKAKRNPASRIVLNQMPRPARRFG